MYARAVEEADSRLRELHHQEWEDLGLAALAIAPVLGATELRPALALPLFLGGLAVGPLGIRALWRHWDLLDRLAGERDAFVIPEVRTFASREATLERRHTFAALIHAHLKPPLDPRLVAVADELDALASELENGELELAPACAIACLRLVSDPGESPLLDVSVPAEELNSRVRQIRSGFQPRRLAARVR